MQFGNAPDLARAHHNAIDRSDAITTALHTPGLKPPSVIADAHAERPLSHKERKAVKAAGYGHLIPKDASASDRSDAPTQDQNAAKAGQANIEGVAELPKPPLAFGERTEEHDDYGNPVVKWKFWNDRGKCVESIRTTLPNGKKRMRRKPKGMKGPWHPLYHQHLDFGQPIVICEGEKATDAVWEAGQQATCWLGGSGSKGAARSIASWLNAKGARQIILWPDHDEVGVAAMRAFREALPQDVKLAVVDWGKEKGDDAADLDVDGRQEQVAAAIEALNAPKRKTKEEALAEAMSVDYLDDGPANDHKAESKPNPKDAEHDAQAEEAAEAEPEDAAEDDPAEANGVAADDPEPEAPKSTATFTSPHLKVPFSTNATTAIAQMKRLMQKDEEGDVERLMRFMPTMFLRVQLRRQTLVYICTLWDGLWKELDHTRSDEVRGIVSALVELGRKRCLEIRVNPDHPEQRELNAELFLEQTARSGWEDDATVKARETRDIVRHAVEAISARKHGTHQVETVTPAVFNDRETHPVMPIAGGTNDECAWDVSTNDLVPVATFRQMRFLANGWAIPKPMPTDLTPDSEAVAFAKKVYGEDGRFDPLVRRTAAYLGGTHKAVDVVLGPPNVGKSTFYDVLSMAFPSAVEQLAATSALHRESSRFTPTQEALTRTVCVQLDEADKLRPNEKTGIAIQAGTITPLCAETLTVELKKENMETVRRMGTVVIVGNSKVPPAIEYDREGVGERMQWAYIMDGLDPLTDAQRRLLRQPDAVDYLRNLICELAHEGHKAGTLWRIDPERQADSQTLREKSVPDDVKLLRRHFVKDQDEVVPSEDVKAVLEAHAPEDAPKTKGLNALMRRAFGSEVASVRTTKEDENGKRLYVWKGLRHAIPPGDWSDEAADADF